MKLHSIILFCLVFSESVLAGEGFNEALELNRKAWKDYATGDLKKSYLFLQKSYDTYAKDNFLNTSLIRLAHKIYRSQGESNFDLKKGETISIGFVSGKSRDGKEYQKFRLGTYLLKKFKLSEVSLETPSGRKIILFPKCQGKDMNYYDAENPKFKILLCHSKRLQPQMTSGLYKFQISFKSGKKRVLPLFSYFAPHTEPFPKVECFPKTKGITWELKNPPSTISGIENGAMILQYKKNLLYQVGAHHIEVGAKGSKGKFDYHKKGSLDYARLEYWDIHIKGPLTLYTLFEVDSSCQSHL